MEIVWLASYPKSGNTWVRFLFTNLIHGPFETSQTIFEVTPVLERGVDPANLHEDRINLIKTHKLFAADLPFMQDATRIVYIVRNPFDVMMSNLNYFFLTSGVQAGADVQKLANQYVTAYLQNGGDPRWAKHNYGTWVEHVDSWLNNTLALPVKVVKYEDLLTDPAPTLADTCEFLSLKITSPALEQAVERSSFENMQALEEREIRDRIPGMFYTAVQQSHGDNGFRFMNRGKSGVALEALPESVLARFRAAFAPRIDELGYT